MREKACGRLKPFAKVFLAAAAALSVAAGVQARAAGSGPASARAPRSGDAGLRQRFNNVTVITRSSQAVLAYLRRPGKDTLKTALETCLASREKMPGEIFNDFLLAFAYHETGDSAREQKALARHSPEQKSMYAYIFFEHRKELPEALYYLPAYLCRRLRETSHAAVFFPPGAVCPAFGGPIRREEYSRGNRTSTRFICAKCDAMLGIREKKLFGSTLLARKNNDLTSIVLHLASGALDSSRRLGSRSDGALDEFISKLGIKEGDVVADIGSGPGYLTFPLAKWVGPGGKVYAEDIDGDVIDLLRYCVKKGRIGNVVPVLGESTDMKLPTASIDAAVLFHVYGDILVWLDDKDRRERESFLDDFFAHVSKALKDGGVFILADTLDPDIGYTAEKTKAALERRGFRFISEQDGPAERHVVLFFKKTKFGGSKAAAAK